MTGRATPRHGRTLCIRRTARKCSGAISQRSPRRSRGAPSTGCRGTMAARSGSTTRRRSCTARTGTTPIVGRHLRHHRAQARRTGPPGERAREREAAERLRSLDEMKNTFLAAVSHELRSPLTSILGLALTLERSAMSDDDRDDLLERLAANARKLDRLLKDLLDIDRLNRGIVEPSVPRDRRRRARSPHGRETSMRSAERTVRRSADPVVDLRRPGQGRADRREPRDERAPAHRRRLHDLGHGVEPHEGGVLIASRTTGRACRTELREAIFEPFRQGPTISPHAPRHRASGCRSSRRFAELHGGRAWVDDRAEAGRVFHVFLPAGPMNARRAPPRPSPADAASSRPPELARRPRRTDPSRSRARLGDRARPGPQPAPRRLYLPIVPTTACPRPEQADEPARKPPWLKVRLATGPNHAELEAADARPRPPHGVRGGDVPEHRRVLGAARGDVPDPRRPMHPPLRLLRRHDRPSRARRRATSPRAIARRLVRDGLAVRRAHGRRARRPARRRCADLGRRRSGRCAKPCRTAASRCFRPTSRAGNATSRP